MIVLTKTDLPRHPDFGPDAIPPGAIETSSKTGAGLAALGEQLRLAVLSAGSSGGDVVPSTAVRCRQSLVLAAECLARARRLVDGGGEELLAAELRVALDELGRVAGAVYTDDVLDRIFSRFCIGK